ncbi:alpha/beta hydrolase [Candidatus Amoebophilus asiaticus]|nr:alpha/beta hydrolase [Candidatus Amoebophilus asiaticus]
MKKTFLILATLMIWQMSWALKPVREYKTTPKDYDMNYEEITIPAEDGLKLFGWYFKPMEEGSKRFIIVVDDGIGNMSDNIELISNLLTLDYHVISFDFRGFGKSEDFEIENDFFIYSQFIKDLQGVIKYMRKYHTVTFDSYGIGMGAGLLLSVAANKTEIRRVIADAPYLSFDHIKNREREKKNVLIKIPKVYNKYYMEPIYALEKKGNHLTAILYIVGQNDVLVTPDDIKKVLVKLKKKVSKMYVVKGATNAENFTANKDEYFEQIKDFLIGG